MVAVTYDKKTDRYSILCGSCNFGGSGIEAEKGGAVERGSTTDEDDTLQPALLLCCPGCRMTTMIPMFDCRNGHVALLLEEGHPLWTPEPLEV